MAIGQRIPMVDAAARVGGTIDYILNFELPGMLHAAILRSPHAHARIVRIDASRAAAMPGVKAVLTGPAIASRTDIVTTFGLFIRDESALAADRVRYSGEPVAAVAAVDKATARAALDLVDVEYEPLPAIFDVERALEPGAPILHEGPRILASRRPDILARQPGFEGSNVIHLFTQRRGDVAAGFAAADVVIERTYSNPAVGHVPFEPHVAVASWTPDGLSLWTSTQAPNWIATELANMFRLPVTRVRVVTTTLGGGYGAKIDPAIEPIVALLAQAARRPVRLALDRAEEFQTHTKHAARIRIKTGVMRDGTLVAHEATCWYNGGAYAKETPEKIFRGYASMGPYRVPNVHVDSYGVYTNVVPSAAFRGFGIPQVAWAHESQMDVVADALGHRSARAPPEERPAAGRHLLDGRADRRGPPLPAAPPRRGGPDRLDGAGTDADRQQGPGQGTRGDHQGDVGVPFVERRDARQRRQPAGPDEQSSRWARAP